MRHGADYATSKQVCHCQNLKPYMVMGYALLEVHINHYGRRSAAPGHALMQCWICRA